MPTVEAPVPVPEGLLGEAYLATPNATWGRLQRGIGGAVGILPATLGGIMCAFSGLDPRLGPEIDGVAPVFGVFANGAPTGLAWAVAVKLVEPRRARDLLLEAEDARYTARSVAAMTQVVPKGGSLPVAAAIANGGYLILAQNDAALERLGPYAYRTLPTKSAPSSGALVVEVPGSALKGPVRARLSSMWDAARADLSRKDDAVRAQHGGRAPDFGDPREILATLDSAVQERLAFVGDLDAARVVADADDAMVHADVTLTPSSGEGPAHVALAAMRPGDALPLLGDADSPLALVFRDDEAGRAKAAAWAETAVAKALGERLAVPERKRLHAALEGWAKVRGEWTTVGLIGTTGLYARAPVTSAVAAEDAIKDAVTISGATPFKQGLRVRDVKVSAGSATVSYGEPSPRGQEKKVELTWSVKDGVFSLLLQGVAGKGPAGKALGDDLNVAGPVRALGANVTFAAVVQPLKVDLAKAAMPAAPLVVGWGKRGNQGWLHADVSDVLVRELLRSKMGL